jgi:hypothetical protein
MGSFSEDSSEKNKLIIGIWQAFPQTTPSLLPPALNACYAGYPCYGFVALWLYRNYIGFLQLNIPNPPFRLPSHYCMHTWQIFKSHITVFNLRRNCPSPFESSVLDLGLFNSVAVVPDLLIPLPVGLLYICNSAIQIEHSTLLRLINDHLLQIDKILRLVSLT